MAITFPVHLDIYKLLISLTEITDLVSTSLVNHHKQVSYIAYNIGKTMGLKENDLSDLATAGALHDIGGLSLASRIETLDFEMSEPEQHSLSGALLLSNFKPFSRIADLIRFHHVYWNNGVGELHNGQPVSDLSHILHLADRISVLINKKEDVLKQTQRVVTRINLNKERMFVPEMVQAFEELAVKESFWLDVTEPNHCHMFGSEELFGSTKMEESDLHDLTSLFCRIIDFRSKFTATHSSGTSAVAELLASKAGMAPEECNTVKIAGILHDIGKLIVPQETLEKETPLTKHDYEMIRRHPYYSKRILQTVQGFETICTWSAYHHERLDGSGYPFHVQENDLPFGARLLAVADTFTALTEVRPYRSSTSGRGTLKFLDNQVKEHKLDGDIVSLVSQNIEECNEIRKTAQKNAYDQHIQYEEELTKGLSQQIMTTT